jgi:uncharacterized oxidoreductase
MAAGFDAKAITTEDLVKALIVGIKKDQFTIRVGDTKLLYIFNRFFPKKAFAMVNPMKNARLLQP